MLKHLRYWSHLSRCRHGERGSGSRGTHDGLKLQHLLRQSFRGERIVGALAAVVAIAAAAVAALLAASVVAACLLRCTALASSPQLTE